MQWEIEAGCCSSIGGSLPVRVHRRGRKSEGERPAIEREQKNSRGYSRESERDSIITTGSRGGGPWNPPSTMSANAQLLTRISPSEVRSPISSRIICLCSGMQTSSHTGADIGRFRY